MARDVSEEENDDPYSAIDSS